MNGIAQGLTKQQQIQAWKAEAILNWHYINKKELKEKKNSEEDKKKEN
jgi:hypothetical protein